MPDMGLVLKYQKNISFYFRLLPSKTNENIFQKFQKAYYEAILAFFAQMWAKMSFPEKKRRCDFLNIITIYHRAKNQKKLICHTWEKC